MSGKTVITTPFPTVHSVAKELGVTKSRAEKLIQLMDNIRAADAVHVKLPSGAVHVKLGSGGPNVRLKKRHGAGFTKKRIAVKRRHTPRS